jgi:hypothetical protein
MSDPKFPADDWDEERAARAAYGDYVRKLKRQATARIAVRRAGAETLIQRVRELTVNGKTEEEIAEAIDRDIRTVQRYKAELRKRGVL